MTARVVTLGETMALVSVPADGLVRGPAPIGLGGAESNVAIGLARLGTPVTWMSRLGDDGLGAYVRREIRAEGVTVLAAADPDAPTGLMVKELRHGTPSRVRYYRSGSAASRLTPDDIPDELIAAADVLHVTGITPALGPGPRKTVEHAVEVARAAGTLVSLDVNHRRTLWTDDEARSVLTTLLPSVDLLFAGVEEATMLLGSPGPQRDESELGAALASSGPATVVIKLGERGALAVSAGELVRAEASPRVVVDPVGAGDAFVAGYLSALCDGGDVSHCLATGNRAGGQVVTVPGDWEGLPFAADLTPQAAFADEVIR
ncbi:sugar kinase [Paractinoplanes lichenicola]|uniref:Sugar kinase n=1 Tax=Paractinoplanes lichenicola TaxID=2802976 RepID=A0ABS1VVS1_9ACTN|nr:sugar kinase [Actinoplanes lichenicola]MBL7258571.1 sugar kinase [Actinoplanes lichenicola]